MATVRKAQGSGAIAPMIIMLVLLAAIVFYVITVPPGEREHLIGNLTTPSYERTVLDVSPGLISGLTATGVERTYKTLSTVDVDYTPQPATRALSSQLIVTHSLFKQDIGNFSFDVSNKDTLGSAKVHLLITDKIGSGHLQVAVNDKVVFTGSVEVGQEATISLPIDSIVQGSNNLKLYVSSPGIKFWATNSYSLSTVNLVLASYDASRATQIQTFTLTAAELAGVQSATLTASIKQISEASGELKLTLNGNEIYKATPAQVASLSVDIPTSLLSGTNTLQWNVAKDGAYSIVLGQVTLATSKFEGGGVASYGFTLTSTEGAKLQLHTLNCELKIVRTPIATSSSGEELPPPPPTGGAVAIPAIDVKINGAAIPYLFSDDTVTDSICKYLHSGSNIISLSAGNDIFIQKLTIKVTSA
jgi:hypothetical protein